MSAKPISQWIETKGGDGYLRRYELAHGDKVNGYVKVGKDKCGAQVFGANDERELLGFHETPVKAQRACDEFVKSGCLWSGATKSEAADDRQQSKDPWGESLASAPKEQGDDSGYGIARLRSMARDLTELADYLEMGQ